MSFRSSKRLLGALFGALGVVPILTGLLYLQAQLLRAPRAPQDAGVSGT